MYKKETRHLTTKQKLDFYSQPIPESGCIIWTGNLNNKGYGMMGVNGKYKSTHRISYEEYKGPIPDGMQVLHYCDIRCCINPHHFFVGTQADNMTDKKMKGRSPKGQKHYASKITDEQKKIIIQDKRFQRIIAFEYGVHQAVISRIKAGIR